MRRIVLLLCLYTVVAFGQKPPNPQFINHKDAAPSTSAPTAELRDCAACPVLMTIPSGSFLLGGVDEGNEADRTRGELPALPVTMTRPFAIGKFEVTVAEFRVFVEAIQYQSQGDCRVTNAGSWARLADRSWHNPGFTNPQGDLEPVVCVSWDDARAYVDWLSKVTGKVYRLPSETEWEYAARGGTSTPRYFGAHDSDEGSLLSLACDYANVYDASAVAEFGFSYPNARCNDGFLYTAPVGTFKPNAFDLFDMLGNVREWLQDCYTTSYRGRPADGRAWQWAGGCELRGVRGGSWATRPAETRASARGAELQGLRQSDLGFRVARDL